MRKSVIAFLTMLTLALGIAPAFALATPGGGLSEQAAGDAATITVKYQLGSESASSGATDIITGKKAGETISATELSTAQSAITFANKSNYRFVGWYEDSYSSTATPITSYDIAADKTAVTLLAYYEPRTYTVTFYGKDNTTPVGTLKVNYGEDFTAADAPADQVPGYYTGAWYKAAYSTATGATNTAWDHAATTGDTVQGDTELYGHWLPITYTVSVDANNGGGTMTWTTGNTIKYEGTHDTSATDKTQVADSIKIPANTFTGTDDASPKVSHNEFANWNTVASPTPANPGIELANEATITNTTFSSVNTDGIKALDKNGSEVTDDANAVTWTNAIILYAQWNPYWKVEFDNDSLGKKPADQKATASWTNTGTETSPTWEAVGAKVTDPGKLTSDGYTFEGWYKENTFANEFNFDTDTVKADTTIYAKWSINTSTVKFVCEGLTVPDQKVETGGKATEPTIAATAFPTGYSAVVWYTDEACTTGKEYAFSTTTVSKDITLYGKLTPINYSVKFEANGGAGSMSNQPLVYDEEKALAESGYTKGGSQFVGWATSLADAANGTVTYVDQQKVKNLTGWDKNSNVVTLYAVYKQAYKLTYRANVNSEANSGYKQEDGSYKTDDVIQYVEAGAAATLRTVADLGLERQYYDFNGWKNVSHDSYVGDDSTYTDGQSGLTKSADTDLTAQWKGKIYSVTYDLQGGTGTAPTQYMQYSAGVVNEAGTALDSDGKTEAEVLAVGGTFNQATSLAVPTAAPTKEGYTFKEWNDKADGTGNAVTGYANATALKANATVYAIWTSSEFTVKYDSNSSTAAGDAIQLKKDATAPANAKVVYGSETVVTVPDTAWEATGKHYTFAGWNTVATPTADNLGTSFAAGDTIDGPKAAAAAETGKTEITLYAQWTPEKVDVTFYNFDGEEILQNSSIDYYTAPVWNGADPTYTADKMYTYTFLGWAKKAEKVYADKNAYTADTTDGNITLSSAHVEAATKYYAAYSREIATYKVSFDNSGVDATAIADEKVKYGNTITTTTKPEAEGYTFQGWYSDEGLTQAWDAAKDVVKDDTTLYAKWDIADGDTTKLVNPPAAATGLKFNRQVQTGVAAGDGYTLSGEFEAKNAGAHTAFADVDEGYLWADGSASTKVVEWSIEAVAELADATNAQVQAANLAQDKALVLLATVETSDNGSDVYVDKTWITAADYDALKDAADAYQAAKDGNFGISVKDATTITNTYQAVAGKAAAGTMKYKVAVPKAKSGLKYTGKKLTGVAAGKNYTVKNGAATNGGTYKATVALSDTDTYVWADGTSAAKTVTWKIAAAKQTITAKNVTKTLKGKKGKLAKKATVAVSGKAKTKVTYAKSGKWKAGITLKGNKITVKKGMKKGTYSVKVKITAAASKNYAKATKTVTVKITVK